MEIQIVDKQADTVQVNTTIGCFTGTWCSSTLPDFRRYIVELDSDEVLNSDTVELSNSRNPYIECVGKTIYLTGFVEEIQDGVMFLRLHGSIMMLYIVSDFDSKRYIGKYVRVRLSNINIYDTGQVL